MTAADQPLYSSRIVNSFVDLLGKKYPQVDLGEVLLYARMKPYEVSDERHWFSQGQIDLFHEKVTQQLGNVDVSREAGRHAASGESVGLMGKYVLGMIGPANAFLAIEKASANFTRSSNYRSRRIADNKVEITVTPMRGVEEKAFQCENRFGFFEAILLIFHYEMPVIEHPECLFDGGACCRYIVTWKTTLPARLRSFKNRLLPPLLIGAAALAYCYPLPVHSGMLSVLAFSFLACSYYSELLKKNELAAALSNLKQSTEGLLEEIGADCTNARMVNEVGQAISKQSDIDEVLENVIQALENRFGYDRCLILLADHPLNSALRFRAAFGYSAEELSLLKDSFLDLADPESDDVLAACFRERNTVFVDHSDKASPAPPARTAGFPGGKMAAHSFICCAIVCEGEALGVLAVDNIKSGKKLMQSDISLLSGVAPVIGMSIRNAVYIDRERLMADQIRNSQKMEAVGQLAGGVAHDFNNLLTAIAGFTALAQLGLDENDPAQKNLDQVMRAAERAGNLTKGLLAFSRKQANNPQPVELNGIVENIEKLLGRLIPSGVELRIAASGSHLMVMADSGQIDQVMMNLATNARDAMGGAGVLTIRTGRAEIGEDFMKARGRGAVGSYALLSVSDTGAGMDKSIQAHVFEPFFTTKEVGKGTGLGLSIVYGIVKQHDGYVEIDSEPGVGTTFNIYLPLLSG